MIMNNPPFRQDKLCGVDGRTGFPCPFFILFYHGITCLSHDNICWHHYRPLANLRRRGTKWTIKTLSLLKLLISVTKLPPSSPLNCPKLQRESFPEKVLRISKKYLLIVGREIERDGDAWGSRGADEFGEQGRFFVFARAFVFQRSFECLGDGAGVSDSDFLFLSQSDSQWARRASPIRYGLRHGEAQRYPSAARAVPFLAVYLHAPLQCWRRGTFSLVLKCPSYAGRSENGESNAKFVTWYLVAISRYMYSLFSLNLFIYFFFCKDWLIYL